MRFHENGAKEARNNMALKWKPGKKGNLVSSLHCFHSTRDSIILKCYVSKAQRCYSDASPKPGQVHVV